MWIISWVGSLLWHNFGFFLAWTALGVVARLLVGFYLALFCDRRLSQNRKGQVHNQVE